MDLARLEIFVRIAELASVSRAAMHYGLSPSALSRQLASLEAECHGRLLHRTGRGVRLTDLGQRIMPMAVALLTQAKALSNEVHQDAAVCRGTVRVACMPVIASSVIPRVALLARERYPNVMIQACQGLRGHIEQAVAEGKADLGFVARLSTERYPDRPLAVSPLCLVGPPRDRLSGRPTVELTSLQGVPVVQPESTDPFRASIVETARQAGIDLKVVAEVDSVHLMRDMAAAGVGYALLTMMSVAEEVEAGRLSAARIVNPQINRAIYLIASQRKAATLAVREVSRLIRQVAEDVASSGRWGEA